MLSVQDLHVSVAGKPIIDVLSLTVPAGEVHAIMGPNGAGKSTLSYTLAGRGGYKVTGALAMPDGENFPAFPRHLAVTAT